LGCSSFELKQAGDDDGEQLLLTTGACICMLTDQLSSFFGSVKNDNRGVPFPANKAFLFGALRAMFVLNW
jgi:hypothetical protein